MATSSIQKSDKYRTLRREYGHAKAARRAAGAAWNKNKSSANYTKYRHAEQKWQAVGAALGDLTGTHQKRRPASSHKIHTRIYSAGFGMSRSLAGRVHARRALKSTKTSRRR